MPELPQPVPHTVAAIYAGYEATASTWESNTLSLSAFASDCDRALWFDFRWVSAAEALDGRKLRLFATGHREEERMVADLKQAGITVSEVGPDAKQWTVVALGGHLKGKLDGRVTGLPEAPATEHVLECKTHNEKSFKDLVKKGVRASLPGHYRQMLGYMHLTGLTRALYLAHNKNTDELHVERVEYDAVDALALMARAQNIIQAVTPPGRVADGPDKFPCSFCRHKEACHHETWPRLHCRTCLHATPVDGGWMCERHDRLLTVADQRQGCSSHLFIPALVPGEQVDCDEAAETVTYLLASGETWVDGAVA